MRKWEDRLQGYLGCQFLKTPQKDFLDLSESYCSNDQDSRDMGTLRVQRNKAYHLVSVHVKFPKHT